MKITGLEAWARTRASEATLIRTLGKYREGMVCHRRAGREPPEGVGFELRPEGTKAFQARGAPYKDAGAELTVLREE